MTHQQLQDAVLACTPAGLWKQAVRETAHIFTEKELMMIAYQQTDTFSGRLKAIGLLAAHASPPAAAFAGKIAAELRKDLEIFEQPEPGCVYELCVEAAGSRWNTNYICTTLAAAKRMIAYTLENDFEPSEISGYTIYKKRLATETFPAKVILPPDEPGDKPSEEWEEIEVGCCEYAPGDPAHPLEPVLLSVKLNQRRYYLYDDENYCILRGSVCLDCDCYCMEGDMQYPDILKPGDIVRYRYGGCASNYFPEVEDDCRYGINILWYIPKEERKLADCYYILPLDDGLAEELREVGFEHLIQHEHIPAPNIEKVLTVEELPQSLQEGARDCLAAYRDYLEKQKNP